MSPVGTALLPSNPSASAGLLPWPHLTRCPVAQGQPAVLRPKDKMSQPGKAWAGLEEVSPFLGVLTASWGYICKVRGGLGGMKGISGTQPEHSDARTGPISEL